MNESYLEIQRNIAKTREAMRQYRTAMALRCLLSEREKNRELRKDVIRLEAALDGELSKRLRCPHAIDAVLDDLLDLLIP